MPRGGRTGVAALLAAVLVGPAVFAAPAAIAGQPAKLPPPDDSFLEFLGNDDVDDAKLWEFFKRPAPKDDEESDDDANGEDRQK